MIEQRRCSGGDEQADLARTRESFDFAVTGLFAFALGRL